MRQIENIKNKRILMLLLLTIALSFVNFNQFIWKFNDTITNIDSKDTFEFLDDLKFSDYSSSQSGTGKNMDILLHQAYLNNSFNTYLNASDPTNNTFYVPCPKDLNFNSSFTRFDVQDISAPNKTVLYEDDTSARIINQVNGHYISFQTKGVGYIDNISIYLNRTSVNPTRLSLYLYNSELDGSIPKPLDLVYTLPIVDLSLITGNTPHWHKMTNINSLFNCSETYANTFYLYLEKTGASTDIEVYGELTTLGGDGSNDNYVLDNTELEFNIAGSKVDAAVEIDFVPLNNTPSPEQIGLKINNSPAIGYGDGIDSGYWESYDVNSSVSGKLQYIFSADWWDVICKISYVRINYTKTDLKANTDFIIGGSGQTVEWNVTRNGGLNYFDSRFDYYNINYTIPNTWLEDTIRVFNGTIPKTSYSYNRSLGNGYRDVNIKNAGNGTFWYLTAKSENLLSSIDTYIGGIPTSIFNFTDIAHFEAAFSTGIEDNDGIINLSVYSPTMINNELNYSIKFETFTGGSVINLQDWDISDNVTQYGDFRVQVFWNNDTAAAFLETNIRILGETELIPSLPKFTFDASETFDIDLFFNDTGLDAGIDTADITYRLNNGIKRSDDTPLGNGNYRLTIDCYNPDFSVYGPNSIEINASKQYYNNQSETVIITILGETGLDHSIPKLLYDSTEIFNVSLFFNDTVKGLGVPGAIRDVYINSTPYTPISNYDYGDGNYNITINCDDDYFDSQGYGYFNLSITVEKSYYYSQSIEYIIYITGETSLSSTKFPDPSIGYYNSDEIFNITVYFEDTGRSEGINGGEVKIYVKEVSATLYQEYTPLLIDPFSVGYYNITVDCSDLIFNPYGKYNIKINVTKLHYYTAEDILEEIIIGNTTFTILSPLAPISYVENEIFEIMVEYEDHTLSSGITGANISYNINYAGYRFDNWVDNLDGTYNITIDAGDADFGSNYGYINIIIQVNKTDYINLTRTFTFERQITTRILPDPPILIEVMRGTNVTYTFNYSDTGGSPIERYDDFQPTTPLNGFLWYLWNDNNGNYTIEIDTSNVIVRDNPYTINFSISVFGNQSQEISLNILVTIIQTNIILQSWNEGADFARSSWINVSIDFYFNDTTNNKAITGLESDPFNNIKIRNFYTGTPWSPGFELLTRPGPGNYTLNIFTVGVDSGSYRLLLNISKYPNYNWSLADVQFYLRGNYTEIHLMSINDPGGNLTSTGGLYNFTIFEGSNIDIEFNVTDSEYMDALVLGSADTYTVNYNNLITLASGTLSDTLVFVYQTPTYGTHVGTVSTSNIALIPGYYLINITITKLNYEPTSFTFNLTVIAKFDVRLDVTKPEEVDAGDAFNVIIKAEYFNGTQWFPLIGSTLRLTPYFNEIPSTDIVRITNSSGETSFEITVRSDATTMNLTIELLGEYNHLGDTLTISDIEVIPLPPGLTFEDFLPYLIIAGIAAAAIGGSVAVYRGVVVPKKREKKRILTEVKTIFDDAISLEHILVLYKGTGTCIFFKSFGSEEIDPELISGFISAISSFGKDLVSQEELNEVSYGDKMLLLSDGEYIRVALVLSKKASLILRRNLMEFINKFEKSYNDYLPKWKGQLNIFREAGTIIDEILSTSIILPHEITYEHSTVKNLKNPHSREILKVTQKLMKDSERNFIFIATLLKEATEKTSKETAEIFMGIKELRDKKILMPLEITTIETKPISQQELNLINQKVSNLVSLSPEEKQKLVNDIAQMGPAEREAYFVSLTERHEIVSAPIETKAGVEVIDNVKTAKKELKKLIKNALLAKKKKDYDTSMKIFQNALKIATNWELSTEAEKIDDIMRLTKIEDLKIKMKNLETEAKIAAKNEKYNEAAQKYKVSSKIASEIFKLGEDLTKEVKRLSNKAKEYEKLL